MSWRRDSMLRTGHHDSQTTSAASAITRAVKTTGGSERSGRSNGSTCVSVLSLNAKIARVIVIALSHEKFPDSISHDWVTTMIAPAIDATGWGANNPNGTTSWAKWLASTSTLCSRAGRWWKYQESGLGIGWVSWWYWRHVRFRQHWSPRHLMSPAPNSMRNSSHRIRNTSRIDGGWSAAPRKTASAPTSHRIDSQPNE